MTVMLSVPTKTVRADYKAPGAWPLPLPLPDDSHATSSGDRSRGCETRSPYGDLAGRAIGLSRRMIGLHEILRHHDPPPSVEEHGQRG